MTGTSTAAVPRNPFATRHTAPGRLAPRNARGDPLDLAALLVRLRAAGRAAIEGPHGAGKTNLLRALADRLVDDRDLAGLVRPRSPADGPGVLRAVRGAPPGTTLCIDSWEALGRTWAVAVRWTAWRRGVGLLVTSHRPTGMTMLVRCETSPDLLARLVEDLPPHGGLIDGADVERAFRRHRGDVREALYDLYDRFERRARAR
ncbi:MAG: hypothetical protein ACKOZU_04820 [Planctomycetaceae bacterium]